MGNETPLQDAGVSPASLRTATVDSEREHHLAMSREHADVIERVLSSEDGPFADWGERGVLCVITESTGTSRTTLLVREVVEPNLDDLKLKEKPLGVELVFEPKYKRRARAAARDLSENAGLLYIHSHPVRAGGYFSPGDRQHDRAQLYDEVQHLGSDEVPLAAMVVHDGDDPPIAWRYDFQQARTPAQRESDDYGPESAERTAITAIRYVGETLEKRPTADADDLFGPASGRGQLNEAQQNSTIRLWNEDGQRRFGGLRVAIVGCGGGGSILAETLARLGVAELVLIDFDRVKEPNANRHQGATQADIDQTRDKVEVCARVAREAATYPEFEVHAVVGSVFENGEGDDGDRWEQYDALDHVLDCDVVMNAADPDTVRCAMSRLAYAHLIPVIDAGTTLVHDGDELTGAARSNVTVAGPGHPCLSCVGQWTDEGFQVALTGEEPGANYADQDGDGEGDEDEDGDGRAPSAMPFNQVAMGLASQRLIHLVQGIAPSIATGKAKLRLRSWSVDWKRETPDSKLESCWDSCNRPAVGTGNDADLKRGPDVNLREERG